jgi:hypothetical protein
VKSDCMIVDGETPGPLQQINIWNDPDFLVSSCGFEP